MTLLIIERTPQPVDNTCAGLQQKAKHPKAKPSLLLEAAIRPTVAHFLWHAFGVSDLDDGTAVYVDWQAHLEMHLLEEGPLRSLFASRQMLSTFLAVKATESLPFDNMTKPRMLALSGSLTVREAVQPLIHLFQEFCDKPKPSIAARANMAEYTGSLSPGSLPSVLHSKATGCEAADLVFVADSPAALSPSAPPVSVSVSPLTSPVPSPSANSGLPDNSKQEPDGRTKQQLCSVPQGHFVLLLRSALLMLKLSSLLQQASAGNTSPHSFALDTSWQTVKLLADTIEAHHTGCSSATRLFLPCPDAAAESEEEQYLSVALTQLLLLVLRQALKSSWPCLRVCCNLLLRLMDDRNVPVLKAVASELCTSGKFARAPLAHRTISIANPVMYLLSKMLAWAALRRLGVGLPL